MFAFSDVPQYIFSDHILLLFKHLYIKRLQQTLIFEVFYKSLESITYRKKNQESESKTKLFQKMTKH